MLEHLIDRVQRDSVVAASDGRQVERQLDLPVLSGKADAVVRDHKLQRPVFGAADGDPDSPRPLLGSMPCPTAFSTSISSVSFGTRQESSASSETDT